MGRLAPIVAILALAGLYVAYQEGMFDPEQRQQMQQQRAEESDPFARAEMHYFKSEYPEAVTAYKKALAEGPDSRRAAEAKFGIARSFEEMGQSQKAIEWYQKLMEEHPGHEKVKSAERRVSFLKAGGG